MRSLLLNKKKLNKNVSNVTRLLKIDGGKIEIRPGHNGPYNDVETALRNTCHLAILLVHFEIFDDKELQSLVIDQLAESLLSDRYQPLEAAYWSRMNREKDFCNGLMGQAWVLESLIELYKFSGETRFIDKAKSLFKLHPYNSMTHSWHRISVDGSVLSPDPTFNHQLWFAAMGLQIDDDQIQAVCKDFFDNSLSRCQVYRNGVIYHDSRVGMTPRFPGVPKLLNAVLTVALNFKRKRALYYKSVGYHSFNLYAFAIIFEYLPNHDFWKSKKFSLIKNVITRRKFLKDLEKSDYGWQYNPPGLEIAYFVQNFIGDKELVKTWLRRHLELTYDVDSQELLTSCAHDKMTAVARLYELYRIKSDLISDAFDT